MCLLFKKNFGGHSYFTILNWFQVYNKVNLLHMYIIHSYILSPLYTPSQSIAEFPMLSSRELVISYLYFIWQCVCICLNLPFGPFNPLHEFHRCWFMSSVIFGIVNHYSFENFFSLTFSFLWIIITWLSYFYWSTSCCGYVYYHSSQYFL